MNAFPDHADHSLRNPSRPRPASGGNLRRRITSFGRCFAGFSLAFAIGAATPSMSAASVGVAVAGGGRSASGVYANLATLGQLAGSGARGGVYQMASGFASLPLALSRSTPPPGAPWISPIADQVVPQGASSIQVQFTIGDPDTTLAQLALSRASSNPDLIPPDRIELAGLSSNRVVRITPVPSQSGVAVVTLTVTDPQGASASVAFRVSVTPTGVRERPRIVQWSPSVGGRLRLRVAAESGVVLSLESSPTLGPTASWLREGAQITSSGAEVELESDPAVRATRFFRIRAD